jgi:hypothetical protein
MKNPNKALIGAVKAQLKKSKLRLGAWIEKKKEIEEQIALCEETLKRLEGKK